MYIISMALRKTAVTPVLMHWSHRSLAQSHQYFVLTVPTNQHVIFCIVSVNHQVRSPPVCLRKPETWRWKSLWWSIRQSLTATRRLLEVPALQMNRGHIRQNLAAHLCSSKDDVDSPLIIEANIGLLCGQENEKRKKMAT